MSALKMMELVWPSALRAWVLLNGVQVRFDSALTPLVQAPDRHKRPADDAFGRDKGSGYLHYYDASAGDMSSSPNANGVQDLNTRMMAHMLGLDVPAIEPSTQYYTGCEWWPPADQNMLSTLPGSNVQSMTPVGGGLYFDQPVMDNWQCTSATGPAQSYLPSMGNNFSF